VKVFIGGIPMNTSNVSKQGKGSLLEERTVHVLCIKLLCGSNSVARAASVQRPEPT
jgi:hypothetical protein